MVTIVQSEVVVELPVITTTPGAASVSEDLATDGLSSLSVETYSGTGIEYNIEEFLTKSPTITVLTPTICDVVGSSVSKLLDGVGKVVFDYGSYRVLRNFLFTGGSTTIEAVTGFFPGSVGALALAALESHLDDADDAHYYNASSFSESLALNPDCWAAAYDLSGVPVAFLSGTFAGGGALVTPRHLLACHHFAPANRVGTTIKFLGSDGILYSATVLAQTEGSDTVGTWPINNPVHSIGDVAMYLLGDTLPEEVAFYPVVGSWVAETSLTAITGLTQQHSLEWANAFLTVDQQRRALFTVSSDSSMSWTIPNPPEIVTLGGQTVDIVPYSYLRFWNPSRPYREHEGFQANPITGDSGSPVFYPYADNSLALCCVTTFPDKGVALTESLLNAMIVEVDTRGGVSTGLTVTVAPDPTI